MTRREIRDRIFKIVFTAEFAARDEIDEQIRMAFDTELPGDEEDDPLLYVDVPEKDRDYITGKVRGIVDRLDDIDATISKISDGWKISRIGKEELAILRLGVYEVMYDDEIPNKVAINEAVELAKKYCDAPASKFINALLAKLVPAKNAEKKADTLADKKATSAAEVQTDVKEASAADAQTASKAALAAEAQTDVKGASDASE